MTVASQRTNERLAELALYVAQKSEADPDFGATKLQKILFSADFTAYAERGKPITGAEYQKLPKGPAARGFLTVQDALIEAGDAAISKRRRFNYEQKRLVALRDPNLSLFDGPEIAIVDRVIGACDGMNADVLSRWSHQFVGWRAAATNETIPYQTVFFSERQLSDGERAYASELASA